MTTYKHGPYFLEHWYWNWFWELRESDFNNDVSIAQQKISSKTEQT